MEEKRKTRKVQIHWRAYIQWFGVVGTFVLLFGNVAAATDKLYWTDIRGIHRVDLDWQANMETPVPVPLVSPMGIAVDKKGGKIYWADSKTRKIQRANLDGTNIEDLIIVESGLPFYVAVDGSRGKLYWTDTQIIQRSNLDGTGIEELVTWKNGVSWPPRYCCRFRR